MSTDTLALGFGYVPAAPGSLVALGFQLSGGAL